MLKRSVILALVLSGPGFVFSMAFAWAQFFPDRSPPKYALTDFGLNPENLMMASADGVTTPGWYIEPPDSPAPGIVLVHGYAGRRERMLELAKFLQGQGYGVILMDLRGHGTAGSGMVTFGIREADDVRPYLRYLQERPEHKDQPTGIMGCSLGAVTALRLASLETSITAVVADSPFDSLSGQTWLTVERHAPGFLVPYFWVHAILIGTLMTGHLPGEWEVGEWIERIAPRPILLLHGAEDSRIPADASRRLVANASYPIESWFAPGAEHLDAMDHLEGEYGSRVSDFFARHLKKQIGDPPRSS